MKKKLNLYIAFAAALLLAVTLAGCGGAGTAAAPGHDGAPSPAESAAPVVDKTAGPEDSAGENGTPESDAPADESDADAGNSDEISTSKFPEVLQWWLDYKAPDAKMRALKEKEWSAHTLEELEGFAEKLEKKDYDEYHAFLNGDDYVGTETKPGPEPEAPYPAILQWFLDYKCDDAKRARKEKEWSAHTPEELEVFAEKLEKEYGDEFHAYLNGEDYVAPEPEDKAPKFGSVEAIAALGGKQATVQKDKDECLVYIFDETKNHGNPYDVTWDYGKDYDSYVEAANWSLVFDAEYYKATFPLLTQLYHNDNALLLKHFQTVGIHEGRQGSKGFNVAAYMDNCGKALRDAFGDDYECYYLYYLLHQDTESDVKTTGSYKKQLAQELTAIQEREFKAVNEYRKEAGSQEVEFDSELAAFANYRAYMDCTEGWDAHDGMFYLIDNNKMRSVFFNPIGADIYCENKHTIAGYAGREHPGDQGRAYRNSEGHYKTMIDTDFNYVGCGNYYVSDQDYNWSGKYDVNVITLDSYADTVNTAYNSK